MQQFPCRPTIKRPLPSGLAEIQPRLGDDMISSPVSEGEETMPISRDHHASGGCSIGESAVAGQNSNGISSAAPSDPGSVDWVRIGTNSPHYLGKLSVLYRSDSGDFGASVHTSCVPGAYPISRWQLDLCRSHGPGRRPRPARGWPTPRRSPPERSRWSGPPTPAACVKWTLGHFLPDIHRSVQSSSACPVQSNPAKVNHHLGGAFEFPPCLGGRETHG